MPSCHHILSKILAFLAVLQLHSIERVNAFSVQRNVNTNSINRIVYGTAALSKADDPFGILDAAYDKGIRRFDLARTYGMGESERIFGEWLESRNINRRNVDIITKGGIGMDRYGDADRPLLTKESLKEEFETSLKTLKLEEIDMYMFHRDDARLGVDKFVEWINAIVSTKKVKRWGVSNWSFERFRAAYKYAIENNLVPPTANSPQFSYAVPACDVWPTTQSISQYRQEVEIEWYAENGVELICWEVLAKGFAANNDLWSEDEVDPSSFDSPVVKGSDEWRLQRIQKAYCNPENYRRRHLAAKLAEKSNLKLAQIAMLYPLSKGKHISVIFGSSKPHHVDEMIELQHFNIDDAAMDLFVNEQKKREKRPIPFVPQLVVDRLKNNVQPLSRSKISSKRFQSASVIFAKADFQI